MRFRVRRPKGTPAAGPPPAQLSPPSIWVGRFDRAAEWHADAESIRALFGVFDAIDDRVLASRHPFSVPGHCVVCARVTDLAMAWHLGAVEPDGSIHPAWTLTACCSGCGLVSRQRALIDLLMTHDLLNGRTYVAEQVTPAFQRLAELIPDLVGSEYLGPDHSPGSTVDVNGVATRHEDLERLSFDDASFDLMITQDVFEHVPALDTSFAEARRVLRRGGRLVFTVPCFPELDVTEVLARIGPDGSVEQLVEPPEIHGNPVGHGSLCLRHIGWDVLDQLRDAGFATATAHCYWAPWAGHLGGPSFVYEATV